MVATPGDKTQYYRSRDNAGVDSMRQMTQRDKKTQNRAPEGSLAILLAHRRHCYGANLTFGS